MEEIRNILAILDNGDGILVHTNQDIITEEVVEKWCEYVLHHKVDDILSIEDDEIEYYIIDERFYIYDENQAKELVEYFEKEYEKNLKTKKS